MADLRGIIVNEILGTDEYTIRINTDERKTVLYSIDTENCNEDEISVVDKKGKIEPKITKIGNKTILTFDKKSDIYSIAYVKKDFVKNTSGLFRYNEKWGVIPISSFILAFPEFAIPEELSAIRNELYHYKNQLVYSTTKDKHFELDITYRIDSKEFYDMVKEWDIKEIQEYNIFSKITRNIYDQKEGIIIKRIETSLDWINKLMVLEKILKYIPL
jgi:hypothetical protein